MQNIAYSLALASGRSAGTVGSDFGEYRTWLEEAGVDLSAVREIPDEFTASFFANTDAENNQIGSFYTGAMAYSKNYRLADVLDEKPDLVVVSPSDPTAMSQLADECCEQNIPFMYDPSQQVIWLEGDVLAHGIDRCQILIVNEYEWEMIANKTGLTRKSLVGRGKTLIVTHGGDGAHIYAGGEHTHVPVFPRRESPIRPAWATHTGPGCSRASRVGSTDAVRAGRALAASYVLEHVGTQNHHYTLAEFVSRFRTVF